MSEIRLKEDTAPGTPPTGLVSIYVKTDGKLYIKDDTGVETPVGSVESVNGYTGIVVLVKGDIGLGNVDNTSDANKPVSTAQATAIGLKIDLTEKAAANGVATLDGSGKIPVSQLPVTAMEFKGNWDASTNIPTLADGTGSAGDVYNVSVAGTQNLGSGNITFAINDWAIYSGTVWQKVSHEGAVVSVNGYSGIVVLNKADIGLGNVDNTSDVNKPVSTAQAAADAAVQAFSIQRANHTGTQLASTISDFSTTTRGLLSGAAPISYNSGSGIISIPKADTVTDGYLSAADWNTFNSSGGGDINNGGNSFGSNISIGTNDAFGLNFETNNIIASSVDVNQQWSFGYIDSSNRTHGFYKDINAATATGLLHVKIGNSGSAQGSGRFTWGNDIPTGSQAFDINFDPRDNADTTSLNTALIRMQKQMGDNGSNIYFYTADTAGALKLALTIRSDQNFEVAPERSFIWTDAVGGQYVAFKAPAVVTTSTTYTWPSSPPAGDKFLRSDSSSVLTWEDVPGTTGTANKLAYYNASGVLTALLPWSIDPTFFGINCYLNIEPIGGLIKVNFFEIEVSALSDQPASETIGFQFDLHVDRSLNNFKNGAILAALYNVSIEGNNDVERITGIETRIQVGTGGNAGTVNGNVFGYKLDTNIGANFNILDYTGITTNFIMDGVVQNNYTLINATSSGIGQVTNNFNGCYIGNSLNSSSAYLYVGLNTGDVGQNSDGIDIQVNGTSLSKSLGKFFSNSGVSDFWTGLTVGGTQTVSNLVKGLEINLNNISCSNQKAGLVIQDGSLYVESNFNTSIYPASPGFFQHNRITGSYRIALNNPTSNSLIFGNNMGIDLIAEDDMSLDGFVGNLGFESNAMMVQLVVAAGKTVANADLVFAVASVPAGVVPNDGGTITDCAMFRTGGILPFGGSLVVTNLYGLRIDPNLSGTGIGQNVWGLYVDDTGADNWFAKSLTIGGTTKTSAPGILLELAGTGTLEMNNNTIDNIGLLGLVSTGGAATAGQATLVAGTITVATTAITATCNVMLTVQAAGGTQGFLSITNVIAGTSFDILSTDVTETSVVGWVIVELV